MRSCQQQNQRQHGGYRSMHKTRSPSQMNKKLGICTPLKQER